MKNFVILNNNNEHLSLGNFFRVIKEYSNAKNTFLQSDLFCEIFNIDNIANSTVNNYLTGFRTINSKYKNIYFSMKEEYIKNQLYLIPTISRILSFIDNYNYKENIKLDLINNHPKLLNICSTLYSISKNDINVTHTFSEELKQLLEEKDLYNFIVKILFYIILEKKQPIPIEDSFSTIIEKKIYNTNISTKDFEEFLDIQLTSGTLSINGLTQLSKKNNPFACFEMASLEFYGIITGKPRYDKAYEYYKIAADNKHPVASWAIGYMYYNSLLGNNSHYNKYLTIKYFNKARKLNCSNAFNSFGIIFLNGNYPHIKKDLNKALYFFKKAISMGNIYAYNNLGKLYENEKNFSKALECFTCAADLGESWAANKVGEYYRKGIHVKKDLKKAFNYYTMSSNASQFTLCHWSKYNLAKYFYQNGNLEIGIHKDIDLAIKLYKEISSELKEARKELNKLGIK